MVSPFKTELNIALTTAQAAGQILVDYFRQQVDIHFKPGDEPVTIADQSANTYITQILQEQFPDDLVIAEEGPLPARDSEAKRIWFVDPMDGTREFINGNHEFSVMIGLAEHGQPVLGVVYQPLTGHLYWAIQGQGAHFESAPAQPIQRLHVSPRHTLADLACAVSRSHHSHDLEAFYRYLGISHFVPSGSIGLKLALISRQICDVYINFSGTTSLWDACAPQVILQEAGGRISDLRGQPLSYSPNLIKNAQGILATNGPIHEQLLAEIQPQWQAYQQSKKP